jgi:hypothetical protein
MTDAIRSSFEAKFPVPVGVKFFDDDYRWVCGRLDGVSAGTYSALWQGYLAAKSEPIVLPAAHWNNDLEEFAILKDKMLETLTAQGYQVKEN